MTSALKSVLGSYVRPPEQPRDDDVTELSGCVPQRDAVTVHRGALRQLGGTFSTTAGERCIMELVNIGG
jgi:hypothetical protein